MFHILKSRLLQNFIALSFIFMASNIANAREDSFLVESHNIPEMKAVYATIESVNQVEARARIGGTVASLNIDEGSIVEAGDVIAVVGDNKIALEITVLEAQISSLNAQISEAERDLNRARSLHESGTVAEAYLDNAQTAYDVIAGQLAAAEGEHAIAIQQLADGEVLAPATGIVLNVPITNGTVVLPGESLATMAVESYILRLQLPERHARFLQERGTVLVGSRGDLSSHNNYQNTNWREGTVSQIYPQMQQGRVIADVTIGGLDEFLVGERLRVLVPTEERQTLLIPSSYIFTRFGMDFVMLERNNKSPLPIVVQVSQNHIFPNDNDNSTENTENTENMVEILSGLNAGDRISPPETSHNTAN